MVERRALVVHQLVGLWADAVRVRPLMSLLSPAVYFLLVGARFPVFNSQCGSTFFRASWAALASSGETVSVPPPQPASRHEAASRPPINQARRMQKSLNQYCSELTTSPMLLVPSAHHVCTEMESLMKW